METLNINKKYPLTEISNDEIIALAPAAGAAKPHPAVSDRYSFVSTMQAVNFLRDAGWVPVAAKQNTTQTSEAHGLHLVQFSRKDLDLGDKRLMLNLYNSHNRTSVFYLIGALLRLICGNGMVSSNNKLSFRHRHMGFDAEKFIESARFVAQGINVLGHQAGEWETIDLEPDEKGAFAYAAHQLLYDSLDDAPILPGKLLEPRRDEDRKDDLWTTMNVVQENIIRGEISGKAKTGRKLTTRPVKALDRDKRLNQALWTLTEKMAEIKRAA